MTSISRLNLAGKLNLLAGNVTSISPLNLTGKRTDGRTDERADGRRDECKGLGSIVKSHLML